jgi:hypothetical protein
MRHRRVVHDNIATRNAPVWRARYATPLTPRAVRQELVNQAMEVSEAERPGWLDARRTPLDRLLTDDEANALEEYVTCESILAGTARCVDYAGDRVQTSRGDMEIISDRWLIKLSNHLVTKKRLRRRDLEIISTFCQQMGNDFPISDAEAAISLGLQGSDRRAAWVEAVAEVARKIA